jgi:hypothetical protein
LRQQSKSVRAALVVQHIRFQLKCALSAARPLPFAGSSPLPAVAMKRQWLSVCQVNCLTLQDTHKMAEANRAFSHYRW